MDVLLRVLEWIACVAVGGLVGGILLVSVLSWLLNRPIEDDPEPSPRER